MAVLTAGLVRPTHGPSLGDTGANDETLGVSGSRLAQSSASWLDCHSRSARKEHDTQEDPIPGSPRSWGFICSSQQPPTEPTVRLSVHLLTCPLLLRGASDGLGWGGLCKDRWGRGVAWESTQGRLSINDRD